MVKIFYKVDPEYGERVAKGMGIPLELAKLWTRLLNVFHLNQNKLSHFRGCNTHDLAEFLEVNIPFDPRLLDDFVHLDFMPAKRVATPKHGILEIQPS